MTRAEDQTNNLRILMTVLAVLVAAGLLGLTASRPVGAAPAATNGTLAFDTLISNDLYAVDPGGASAPVRITTDEVAGDSPAYSPDGTRIAFHGSGATNSDVFVMNADGSELRRVTTDNANNNYPAWSPDGTRIVYVSRRDSAAFPNPGRDDEIFVMNADGSGQQRLTNNAGDDTTPAWSPDGTEIAFIAFRNFGPNTNGEAVMVMDATDAGGDGNGDNERIFQARGGPDSDPTWSPDGSRIAWDDQGDILVKAADTGDVDPATITRLTNARNGRDGFQPAWSPDGTKLAFIARRPTSSSPYDLFVMDAATGANETRVTSGADVSAGSGLDWQPIPQCTNAGATAGNDAITGTPGRDVLCGEGGNDTIRGGGGSDLLLGGAGRDTLLGGAENDSLSGGPGVDTASYAGIAGPVTASLTTGFASGEGSDVYSSMENLTGGAGPDTLTGSTPGANVLKGLGGKDTLRVRDATANDTVDGGAGRDICEKDRRDAARNCP